jgi:ABC-type antimicrobial peptide transport system permease subunit
MVNGWRFDFTFPIGPAVLGVAGTILLAVAAAALPARLATRRGYLLEAIEE